MTPTADLMKLVDELNAAADLCVQPHSPLARNVKHFVYDKDHRALLTRAAAALTASCDARVGGEEMVCGGCGQPWTGPCAQQDNGWPTSPCIPVPATPAHPKASEPQVHEDVVLWALGTRLPEEVRARYGYPVHYTVSDYMAGDTNENRLMMRTLLESVSRQFQGFATTHPKASEGKAGGEGWVLVSDQLPPDGLCVLVFWREEGEKRYDFDAVEEGAWVRHSEHYDHYLSVALPENSRGPSEQAPYTHWRYIEAPATLTAPGADDGQ